jgi:chromosome segregation ATPase
MDDIKAIEKRILAAFARVQKGLDGAPPAGDETGLRTELAEERAEVARLRERLRQVPARDPSGHEARIDRLTRQLDVQGIEMQRLRKSNIALREEIRALREAAEEGVDPAAINRAMKDELEALRATRHAEIAEMDEILSELTAMIGEVRNA